MQKSLKNTLVKKKWGRAIQSQRTSISRMTQQEWVLVLWRQPQQQTTALLGAFKRHLSQLNDDPTQLLKNQEQQLL